MPSQQKTASTGLKHAYRLSHLFVVAQFPAKKTALNLHFLQLSEPKVEVEGMQGGYLGVVSWNFL